MPEAPAEDAEGPGLVPEPMGDLGRRGAVGEIGAQRLVLALARLRRFQEEPPCFRYRIWCCLDALMLWLVAPADLGNTAGLAFYERTERPEAPCASDDWQGSVISMPCFRS
jgi:hypothetical protein